MYSFSCHLLSSSRAPIRRQRNGEGSAGGDEGRDDHSLVTRKNSLAPGHLGAALVDGLDGARPVDTVGLTVEGLLNFTVLVTEQTTVLIRR